VGLCGLDELLVITLDEPIAPDDLLQKLNAVAPTGCRFTSANEVGKAPPQPRRIQMEMRGTGVPPVSSSDDSVREQCEETHGRDGHATETHGQDAHATVGLADRLAQLAAMPQWPIQRESWKGARAGVRRDGQSTRGQTLDLRPMVQFELTGDKLNIVLTQSGSQWARPSEVMRLLGLDERADLARICRTKIEYEYPCAPAPAADAASQGGATTDIEETRTSEGPGTDNSLQSGLAPTEAASGPTGECTNG
jgi:hypothetical protein